MSEGVRVPKKYWWVVAVAVPLALALIAVLPGLFRSSSDGPAGPVNTATVTGDNNTVYVGNTFITNVNIIAKEYELQTGKPLGDDLRRQIEAAVKAAMQNNPAEGIRLLEEVARAAPVPAIYHNLGVAYARTQNAEASRRAFELSKEKLAEVQAAAASNRALPATALTAPVASGPAVRTETSTVPAMTIDPVSAPYERPDEIHVVAHGTALSGPYPIKYRPEPGTTVVMEPGSYDVLMKVSTSGAGFVLASNVTVREGALVRLNPNVLLGGIAVEPVSKQGFPAIKELKLVDRASGDRRRLAQETARLGVVLPIAPGDYEVIAVTAYGQQVRIAESVAVKVGEITRFDPIGQVASVVVRAPDVKGLNMKAVYVLKAGTNQIVAKAEAWDVPLLVPAGGPYDVALEQSAGLTRIRSGVTLARGELLEVR